MPAEKQPLPAFIGKRIAYYDSRAEINRQTSQLIFLRTGMPRTEAEMLLKADRNMHKNERLAEQIRSEFGVKRRHIVARLELKINENA